MKRINKTAGAAALYLAAAYLITIVLFLVVFDYASIVDPIAKVSFIADHQQVMYLSNLFSYILFGLVLVVLLVALRVRLKETAPVLSQVAVIIGFIWAGSLIASGMVSNAGIAPIVALRQQDSALAAATWTTIESVANGLGGANGEILGGLMTLLISWAALGGKQLSKGLNLLGLLVGTIGIVSIIPALNSLCGIFGLTQIVWFVWLGITLLHNSISLNN